MKIYHFLAATALASFPATAWAQDATPPETAGQTAPTSADCAADPGLAGCRALTNAQASSQTTGESDIVVTGTRIARPTLSSPVPVTTIEPDELTNAGQSSLGDSLNDLPALRSTYSQQNSGRFIGTAGLNLLDLRGLGTSRTLVLVNGRRHVTSSPGDFIVDVNTIPQDLLERVDIVTGGEAAVYGSDAVAGVVNFVLKRDFSGIAVHFQDGVSSRGDRGIEVGTITAGKNFADGRGNIAASFEYTNAEPLYFRDRDGLTGAFSGRCQFQTTEQTIGEPSTGDGIPDTTFLCGIRNASISDGGTVGQINAAGDYLRFDSNGNLFVDHPTKSFRPVGSGNQQGGAGSTLRNTGQLAVGQERYNANLLAHFDFSDAFKVFLEAKYVHQNVLQEGQPSFFQGSIPGFFGGGSNLRCNNPFLTTQALTTLQSYGLCGNVATGTFNISRFNIDFGGRKEVDKRDTYRIVGGVQGDFNDDWHYELSVNYGRFTSTNVEENDLRLFDLNGNPDGFLLAIDARRNAAGQIVCGVNADADPTNDRSDCVPINVFGYGAPSSAALAFSNTTSFLYSKATELDIMGYVSGDLSQVFTLPGGPIGFSIGAEYRRETASQHADPLSASGGTFFNAFKPFNPPAFEVKEAFGELNIPLLKDLPAIKELSVSGAARYSDYNTSANHTFAWNVSGIYAPISDLRFRANYSKSVRVPTLGDLYSPASVNFGFVDDPCDSANINNGTNRKSNCAALGVPTTVTAGSPCVTAATPVGSPFINCVARAQTIEYESGGNPDLQEETGKSLTIGAIFTPRFLRGFSMTVDYFDIKVENLIATLGAQTILNQCVDLSSTNNQYCQLIHPRDQYGLLQSPALLSSGINYAKQTTRGIDFDLAYRHTFDSGLRLNLRGLATYTLERNNFVNPVDPSYVDRQLSELGDPVFSGSLIAGAGKGIFDLQYTLRYIGQQTIGAYETQHSLQGRPPTNPDAYPQVWYPDVFYHDVRLNLEVSDSYQFYFGVDNVFDTMPPLGLLGTEAGSPFSSIGRYFYGGVHIRL